MSDKAIVTVTAEDVNVTKIYTIAFSVVSGVNYNTAQSITLYPNPATDYIKVANVELGVATIISAQGTVVGTYDLGIDNTISVSGLPAGIYTIKIDTKNTVSISKFMKN